MLYSTASFLAFIDHAVHPDRATGRNWWTALRESAEHVIASFASNQEPHVSKVQHRDGRTTWAVHDLATGYHGSFATEQDVRIWLEKRYYQ